MLVSDVLCCFSACLYLSLDCYYRLNYCIKVNKFQKQRKKKKYKENKKSDSRVLSSIFLIYKIRVRFFLFLWEFLQTLQKSLQVNVIRTKKFFMKVFVERNKRSLWIVVILTHNYCTFFTLNLTESILKSSKF